MRLQCLSSVCLSHLEMTHLLDSYDAKVRGVRTILRGCMFTQAQDLVQIRRHVLLPERPMYSVDAKERMRAGDSKLGRRWGL